MPRVKGILIDRKPEEESKICDACHKPRSVLVTAGENYLRLCTFCAEIISDKLQKSLEKEPQEIEPKQVKGAGNFTICAACMEVTQIGTAHSCKKKRRVKSEKMRKA